MCFRQKYFVFLHLFSFELHILRPTFPQFCNLIQIIFRSPQKDCLKRDDFIVGVRSSSAKLLLQVWNQELVTANYKLNSSNIDLATRHVCILALPSWKSSFFLVKCGRLILQIVVDPVKKLA